jgi:hypothetical protein
MVWIQLRAVRPSSRIRPKCGNLHIEIAILNRGRRPYGSHQLVPQHEVSGLVEKDVENVKGT